MIAPSLLALVRRRWLRSDGAAPNSAADTENMRQLIQLRWLAVAGQLVTILVVAFGMKVTLPLPAMLGAVAAAALVNLGSVPLLRHHQVRQVELLAALMFDVGLLTFQLYLSGGAGNPFVALYLLQVVLGAILLERWASWVVAAAISLSFGLLIAWHLPLRYPAKLVPIEGGLYMIGSWVCFALIGVLLVLFVTRIVANLHLRDERLADMRQQAIEEDHLVRMGLFASGAAHELGTPLATLAVILGDWRRMPRVAADRELMDEIGEMQAAVQRCKTIVTDVLHSVAELPGNTPERIDARAFLGDMIAHWRALHPQARLVYRNRLTARLAIAADPALRQAVWNLLDNAAEASIHEMGLEAAVEDGALRLTIRDGGPGFPPAMLAQFGAPRQSAKGPGHGVGLFLVVSVVRRLGGTVAARNRSEGGAEVTITLPLARIAVMEPPADARPPARHRRG